MKKFKTWLEEKIKKESITGTNCVSHYSLPIGGLNTRMYPPPVTMKFGKKKHGKKM